MQTLYPEQTGQIELSVILANLSTRQFVTSDEIPGENVHLHLSDIFVPNLVFICFLLFKKCKIHYAKDHRCTIATLKYSRQTDFNMLIKSQYHIKVKNTN